MMVEGLREQLDKIIWQIILDARDDPRMDFRSYKINRVNQILNHIIERVKGIEEPNWYEDWGGEAGKAGYDKAIQAVIKGLDK